MLTEMLTPVARLPDRSCRAMMKRSVKRWALARAHFGRGTKARTGIAIRLAAVSAAVSLSITMTGSWFRSKGIRNHHFPRTFV
jgi:hypothetical protein